MSTENTTPTLEELAGIIPPESPSTALSLNSDEVLSAIQQEVVDEFQTSDKEVYKVGLRSILEQQQQYEKQIRYIQSEITDLQANRKALDNAFKNGELKSVDDMRGVTRSVLLKKQDKRSDKTDKGWTGY